MRDRLVLWLGGAAILLALAPTASPRSLASSLQQARVAWAAGLPGTVFHLGGRADLARREWTAAMELDPQGAYGLLARRALVSP